jgi:hypothetical protein
MTAGELQLELDAVCRQYRVTRAEMRYGVRKRTGRPRAHGYIQMARGVFIVRCARCGAGSTAIARALDVMCPCALCATGCRCCASAG